MYIIILISRGEKPTHARLQFYLTRFLNSSSNKISLDDKFDLDLKFIEMFSSSDFKSFFLREKTQTVLGSMTDERVSKKNSKNENY